MNLYILQLQFINCRIDATHRKGRIGKWQPRKQPRNQRRRRPRRPQKRPRRKSSGSNNPKGNTQGGRLKAFPLVFLRENSQPLAEIAHCGANPLKPAQQAAIRDIPQIRGMANAVNSKEVDCLPTKGRDDSPPLDCRTLGQKTATIAGAQAEHLARVLRAQPGMEADVVAGGRVFHAEVVRGHPDRRKERSSL